jgi:hypothetical protein
MKFFIEKRRHPGDPANSGEHHPAKRQTQEIERRCAQDCPQCFPQLYRRLRRLYGRLDRFFVASFIPQPERHHGGQQHA